MDWVALAELVWRAVLLGGGVLCLWLACQLLGRNRTAVERTDQSTTDLRWTIADARRAINEAIEEVQRLRRAETSAIEQKFRFDDQGKLAAARESAQRQIADMIRRLELMTSSIVTLERKLGADQLQIANVDRENKKYRIVCVSVAIAAFLFVCAVFTPSPRTVCNQKAAPGQVNTR